MHYLLLLNYLSKESTSLCSNKPVSVAGLEQGAESILVYLTSGQINHNAD